MRAASVCWLPVLRRWEWKHCASSPEPVSDHYCCLLFTHQRPQLTLAITYIIWGKETAVVLSSAWWNSSTKGSFLQMHLKHLSALLGCLKCFWIYRMYFFFMGDSVFPSKAHGLKALKSNKSRPVHLMTEHRLILWDSETKNHFWNRIAVRGKERDINPLCYTRLSV